MSGACRCRTGVAEWLDSTVLISAATIHVSSICVAQHALDFWDTWDTVILPGTLSKNDPCQVAGMGSSLRPEVA